MVAIIYFLFYKTKRGVIFEFFLLLTINQKFFEELKCLIFTFGNEILLKPPALHNYSTFCLEEVEFQTIAC